MSIVNARPWREGSKDGVGYRVADDTWVRLSRRLWCLVLPLFALPHLLFNNLAAPFLAIPAEVMEARHRNYGSSTSPCMGPAVGHRPVVRLFSGVPAGKSVLRELGQLSAQPVA